MRRVVALGLLASCAHRAPDADAPAPVWQAPMGAHWSPAGDAVVFRVASTRATRVELAIYDAPMNGAERLHVALDREPSGTAWTARVPAAELPVTIYYGYRVWGPNWPYDPAWQPGSTVGWLADVDGEGNRMNPNKLVFDPYARELSHDPTTPEQGDGSFYATGSHRATDSAPVAPKGIVLHDDPPADHVTRPLRDELIYEVHVRGFTQADSVACAGTYAGAAARAGYLADLGVTAVEFLPIAETQNARNDVDATSDSGDNYWGYSTLAYFAPDRRYACDTAPGGPTREFRDMVRAFHARGIKVYLDVVYNHTAEGGGGSLLSLRGIDSAGYYQLDAAGTGFTNSNGVGADVAGNKPLAQALVLDSLRYWTDAGVDGFRFDLAPVLANTCVGCFRFDGDLLAKIAQLARDPDGGPGVDLIAEPWGVVAGSYQVGHFPRGWAEWNDKFRDAIRQDQNQAPITPGWLADRIAGSTELYNHDGRLPAASINYLVSHDGFTLADLYACNAPNNAQAWPYGPSSGGSTTNYSWDHGGDPVAQRQAARTGLALVALSHGVPMIVGGDELLRSQRCNNNPYNLDSPGTWLDWSQPVLFTSFARRLFQFRAAHPALRIAGWLAGEVTWFDDRAAVATGTYLDDATKPVLAWRLASGGDTVYIAYNRGTAQVSLALPPPPAGTSWYLAADTGAWFEPKDNFNAPGAETKMTLQYDLGARTVALFLAR
jgi:glycogen operon protein